MDFIICGDININFLVDSDRKRHINFLVDSDRKRQLEALLLTYNLTSVVNFPTRIQHESATAIDSFFIDITKVNMYSIKPIINGLSDHDAQVLTFFSLRLRPPNNKNMLIGKITERAINYLFLKLSYETLATIFSTDNVNNKFNSFSDSYLKTFHSSFPLKSVLITKKNNTSWITSGILTSCKCIRELFIACREIKNPDLKNYYKNIVKFYLLWSRKLKNSTMLIN
jgi:hypothetical protein